MKKNNYFITSINIQTVVNYYSWEKENLLIIIF